MTRARISRSQKRFQSRQAIAFVLGLAASLVGQANAQQPASEPAPAAASLLPGAADGYVDSGGVKIHYVSLGRNEDPLIVLIHGFPDFWYSWRAQMPELSKHFHVVAIDQRGYNLSGQPEGVENYTTDKLVGDVVAVVKHFGVAKAVIVGHDWGGLVAWTFAMTHPEMTDRLLYSTCRTRAGSCASWQPTPSSRRRTASTPADFQKPDAAQHVSIEFLTGWVKDPEARKVYLAAFKRSSLEGMLNYYKANYPRIPENAASAKEAAARHPRFSRRQMLRALDPRSQRPSPASRRTQRHLELDRQ